MIFNSDKCNVSSRACHANRVNVRKNNILARYVNVTLSLHKKNAYRFNQNKPSGV